MDLAEQPSIDELISLTKEKQRQCERKDWKRIKLGNKEVSLNLCASNAIRWLSRFKDVGDIIAQVDPMHIGVPWAAVRFILHVR